MRINKAEIEKFPIKMECDSCSDPLVLIAARVEEGFNKQTVVHVEFVSDTANVDLDDLVGHPIKITARVPDGPDRINAGKRERSYSGTCVSARFLGQFDGTPHFWAEIRPKAWFLSYNQDCRVFQEMNAPDIIKEVLRDYGADFEDSITENCPVRTICVQYRESDLDFIHRLMEEEGMHYHFTTGTSEKILLRDDSAAATPVPCEDTIAYLELRGSENHEKEHFSEWYRGHAATSGKFTFMDWDFEKPTAKMKSFKSMPKGKHELKEREIYDYPGHYKETADGDRYAKICMEAQAIRNKTWHGSGVVSNIEVGKVFKVSGHPSTSDSDEFVAQETTHFFQLNERELSALEVSKSASDSVLEGMTSSAPYFALVTAIPKAEKYRPAKVTPWPEIAGVQTAVVTGPSGEEIYTDKYGRVRVQFHWDRLGKKDEKSTCWVRCMMPWTGAGWGSAFIPRMGQEVVVQFEEGNPDRPLVVGMLYNADTMPPYGLPGNMTQSGIKTRSTKSGTADNFNELRFEDKKGSEEVYFHAEKDYNQVVENDAKVIIGEGPSLKNGDMTMTIHRHLTETVKEGNHTFTVKQGDQTMEVTQGKQTETVNGNVALTVKQGNVTRDVKMGNVTDTINMGNYSQTVKMGNHTTKVSLGSIKMEAMQMIELKVGSSSIKLDQSGVTIKGIMIKVEGQAMTQVQAPMVKVNGSGMVMVQGGLIKIN